MGKIIRRKEVKAKVKGDFKKVKAKVGKKVARANVTKISVKFKQLKVPVQSIADGNDYLRNENEEQEKIREWVRNLAHFSEATKKATLDQIKDFFLRNQNAEKYLALLVPKSLELLFDESEDIRKAVVQTINQSSQKCSSESFQPINSIFITYVCSGLTSLNKAIRKDSMSILMIYLGNHISLCKAHIEKIADHIFSLLPDPSTTGNLEISSYMSSSAKSAKALSIPYQQMLPGSHMITTSFVDPLSLLLCICHQLTHELHNYENNNSNNSNNYHPRSSSHKQSYDIDANYISSCLQLPVTVPIYGHLHGIPRGIEDLQPHHRTILQQRSSTSISEMTCKLPLPISFIQKLFHRLYQILSCLVTSESSTGSSTSTSTPRLNFGTTPQHQDNSMIVMLSYIQTILTILSEILAQETYAQSLESSLKMFLREIFPFFPFQKSDAINSLFTTTRKEMQINIQNNIKLIDFSICEIIITQSKLAHNNYNSNKYINELNIVSIFLSSELEQLMETNQKSTNNIKNPVGLREGNQVPTDALLYQNTDEEYNRIRVISLFNNLENIMNFKMQSDNGMIIDDGVDGTSYEGGSRPSNSSSNKRSPSSATSTSSTPDIWSLLSTGLHRLLSHLTSALTSASISPHIRASHHMTLRPAVLCLCRLTEFVSHPKNAEALMMGRKDSTAGISSSSLETSAAMNSQSRCLTVASVLSLLPTLLSSLPGDHTIISNAIFHAMLSIVRTVPDIVPIVTGINISNGQDPIHRIPEEFYVLGMSILSLFPSESEYDSDISALHSTDKHTRRRINHIECFYHKCSLELRCQLLSIWYYSPYHNVFESTRIVLEGVASSKSSATSTSLSQYEDSFVLRLLMDRRQFLSPFQILSLLSYMLKSRIQTHLLYLIGMKRNYSINQIINLIINHRFSESHPENNNTKSQNLYESFTKPPPSSTGMLLSTGSGCRWLAHDIADTLKMMVNISSTSALKILISLIDQLQFQRNPMSLLSNNHITSTTYDLLFQFTWTLAVSDILCCVFIAPEDSTATTLTREIPLNNKDGKFIWANNNKAIDADSLIIYKNFVKVIIGVVCNLLSLNLQDMSDSVLKAATTDSEKLPRGSDSFVPIMNITTMISEVCQKVGIEHDFVRENILASVHNLNSSTKDIFFKNLNVFRNFLICEEKELFMQVIFESVCSGLSWKSS